MTDKTAPRWVKPATEYGPLAVFLVAYLAGGLMAATAAIMVATALAIVLSLVMTRSVPIMPLITAGVVGVFGGLTLWLNDETFFKMKPTIVQIIFAAILLGGLLFKKPLLAPLLGKSWPMDHTGWTKLTFRFGLFFIAMAALNEVVWRTQSTDVWVTFKVIGIIVLTLAFAASQAPLMMRHRIPEEEDKKEAPPPKQ